MVNNKIELKDILTYVALILYIISALLTWVWATPPLNKYVGGTAILLTIITYVMHWVKK